MAHRSAERTEYVSATPCEATLSFLGQENPGVNVAALSQIFAKIQGGFSEVNNSRASMNNFATMPGRRWRARHVSSRSIVKSRPKYREIRMETQN